MEMVRGISTKQIDKSDRSVKTVAETQTYLRSILATQLRIPPESIDVHEEVENYGLDSLDAMTVMGKLSDWSGQEIAFEILWDYPTIAEVSQYLVEKMEQEA